MESLCTFCFPALKISVINSDIKSRFRFCVHSLDAGNFPALSSDSIERNRTSCMKHQQNKNAAVNNGGNEKFKLKQEKMMVKDVLKDLTPLWDDGYGSKNVKNYLDEAKEIVRSDGGPPRWFCPVECGEPLKNSPTLLFLPGIDGVGLGLILHHKALGKAFEVRCLHIPVYDRTPFEGLIKLVEETVRLEHASAPNKPIYLVGDSLGGCLALAVAARNPDIDLILLLVNPATSFGRSQLQLLLPILEGLPQELHNPVPYLLSFVMGNPMKMGMVDIDFKFPPIFQIEQLSANLAAVLPSLSVLADIIPKDTLVWKLNLLKSAAAYANSRLHAVKAEVLVLASGQDYLLPSADEAQRLKGILQNCKVRCFDKNGHALLLEDSISLLTIIRGTFKYRHSRRLDIISDFIPPSKLEYKCFFDEIFRFLDFCTGSALFSTLEDGKIVRGLAGVPNEGPVILVGYHMLMGLEIFSVAREFLREKKIMVRGVAHPQIFSGDVETITEFSVYDWMKVMGAVPVTPRNLYNLLSSKQHVLLYPGGAREALHYKGEAYKIIWPDQQEFVRMAARFGATIVPFGAVGEDDLLHMALDYNDLMQIPVLNDYIREAASTSEKLRDESKGEVANQQMLQPVLLPKLPGRFYLLFGKPIETKGKQEMLRDRESANQLYMQIQSEVASNIAYLLKKREKDPYRNIIDRTIYRTLHSPMHEVPAFDL